MLFDGLGIPVYRWYADTWLVVILINLLGIPLFLGLFIALLWPSLESRFFTFAIPLSIIMIWYLAEFAFAIGSLLIEYRSPILNVTHYRGVVPFATILAVFAYRLRGSRPKIYGVAEMMIGVTTISVAVQADEPSARLLTIASGIYIWVRGMDNFDKGLSGTMKDRWRRAFPRPD